MKDFNLYRLESFEGKPVKYAISNKSEKILVTLVDGYFDNEMNVRFSNYGNQFEIRGHRSIMDLWTFDQFKEFVLNHLNRNNVMKESTLKNKLARVQKKRRLRSVKK
jgi:hypothetical protein